MKNKKLWLVALIVCCLVGIAFTLHKKTAPSDGSEYVTVKDGHFYIGDNEYRYVGTNFWYGAILASEGQGGNRERLAKELDLMQEVGINNIRVLVGGDGVGTFDYQIKPTLQTAPGVYNDTILQGLDYLMAELENRNMKAVLYLNNAWEWSGGFGVYLDWAGMGAPASPRDWNAFQAYHSQFTKNEKAMELAANHTRFIVSRVNTVTGKPYSESPALMAWELANEPRAFSSDPDVKFHFAKWIQEQAKLIKSIDPNHLVTTGSEGKNGCEGDMDLFETIHSFQEIDYACIHVWPFNWAWLGTYVSTIQEAIVTNGPESVVNSVERACQNTKDYIEEAYARMAPLGKPMVLEEFGYPRDNYEIAQGTPTTGRDAYFKYVFSIIRDSGKIAGCNFWSWGGLADVKHANWQPWDDYTGDPAQEEQGLNSIFGSDATTMQMIKELALTPTATVTCTNDEDWVSYTGDPLLEFDVDITSLCNGQHADMVEIKITDDKQESELLTISQPNVTLPATIHVKTEGKCATEPGFYHIYVNVDGKNVTKNATEVYGSQLVIDHYVYGIEPEKIISAPDAQPDFQEFWDKARAELAAVPMRPVVTERKDQVGEKKAYIAQVRGLEGDLVQIDYTVPTKPGKYPVHIINMGYSSKPWDLDLTDNGWIDVIVSSRGQGRNDATNRFGDWVRFGLQNPETYYYRGAYLDCTRAIDYLFTLPEVDQQNIFLEGGSQGGAYSMAAAALDHRVTAIACYITFMSDFPDYFKIVEWPYSAIHEKQMELGMSDEDLYRNLSYFDIKNLAQWIECPVYLGMGLQDVTCPPHTNISGYNLVNAPKEYHIYRNYGHHVDYDHWNPAIMAWYEKYMVKN